MKVAVVGGGLAGLSCAWYLLREGHAVTLFEKDQIGSGASGIASGLLHGYPAKDMRPSLYAKEAIEEARYLFGQITKETKESVILSNGIIRLATHAKQKDIFQIRMQEDPTLTLLSPEEVTAIYPYLKPLFGIKITDGMVIDTETYLRKLYYLCKRKGLEIEHIEVKHPEEVKEYDLAVFSCGASIKEIQGCADLKIRKIKGQLLKCEGLSPLHGIIGDGYLAPSNEQECFFLGSTYEHTYESAMPFPEKAREVILKKAKNYLTTLNFFEVIDYLSGIRVALSDSHLPKVIQKDAKTYIITGLGSRGLLYHALLGKILLYFVNHDQNIKQFEQLIQGFHE